MYKLQLNVSGAYINGLDTDIAIQGTCRTLRDA